MINFSSTSVVVSPSPYSIQQPGMAISDEKETMVTDVNRTSGNSPKESKKYSKDPDLELTQAEVQELSKLKQRDREVKAHEQAHIMAGGQYVRGGAHYEYQKGPDGRSYAVGGEVQIDTSKIPGDPEATARKMAAIKRAAMAPAEPSAQDRRIASKASRIESQMTMEMMMKLQEEKTTDPNAPQTMTPKGSLIDIHQ